MTWQSDVLIKGKAAGPVLRLDAPISFWGGINPATSEIVLAGHPQAGERIAGRVLVVPQMVGSSSSSAVMLELCYAGLAPTALILGTRDSILPIGVLVAGQMNWETVPTVVMVDPPFLTGEYLHINGHGTIERCHAP